MLRFLADRQSGICSPRMLECAEATRRTFSLQLSKFVDVERIHDAAINTLDIDLVEDRYLLSGASNGNIVVHDLECASSVPQYSTPSVCHVGPANRQRHRYSVETVQWLPTDTGMFLSSGMDSLLKVWDTNTLTTVDEFKFSGGVYRHDMSLVATQHCLVAVASHSNNVKLVDLKTGSATHVLRAHRQPVLCLNWSPKEEFLLATASLDSKVILWDIRSAKGPLIFLDQHNGDTMAAPSAVNTAHDGLVNCVQFTPDGIHLVTFGSDDNLRLWRVYSGRNTMVNYGRISNKSRKAVSLSVSHQSSPQILFVPDDNDIAVFELGSGRRLDALQGHYNQVNSCIFQQSVHDLYSCGSDRNILIWKPYLETFQAYENYLRENYEGRLGSQPGTLRVPDSWSDDDG